MSGIVGLFNLDGRPATASELDVLSAGSKRRFAYGSGARICASFGILHQHSGTMPTSFTEDPQTSASGIVVAFNGRLDNREELLERSSPSERLPADSTLVLAAYQRYGESFASRLNGDFVAAVFDPRHQRLLLARDIMGAYRLYYCHVAGTLLFASTIKSLLADPRLTASPDEDGVTDLVLDGWEDGNRTCFKGVFSVPPGHILIARENHIELQQHWAFDPLQQVRFPTLTDYAERFRLLFEQSVRRRLRTSAPVACTVSGGLDSSSIFCQAALLTRRERIAPTLQGFAWTFPAGTPADEQVFLDSLDGVVGGRITRLPVASVRVLNTAEATVGEFEAPGSAWDAQHELLERARNAGCSVILDGYFGDQMLFGRRYLLDLAGRGHWTRVRRDLSTFAAWMTDVEAGVFQREFLNMLARAAPPRWLFQLAKKGARGWRSRRYPSCYSAGLVRRLLERQLGRFEPGSRSGSYHSAECYRHATGGHCLAQVQRQSVLGQMHGIDVWYPFRDRDLVEFLMAVPGDVVNCHGVPKGLLRQALAGILPEAIRNRRSKADFTNVANQAVLEDYENAARLLTRDCAAARLGFVDGDRLERSVISFKADIANTDDAAAGWQLGGLVGLELWLRRFVTGPSRTPCIAS